ncbi:MAG: acetylxylan esterase [Bifidobacteriaceae bacterium]|jgi:cephalosporin-C deacetylase|nr:acetylxylan esterase [Bifidobacteriaceae bacterium]
MYIDLPLEQLREYRGLTQEPSDFDQFWADTLDASRAQAWAPKLVLEDTGLTAIDVYDLRFAGYGGQPIAGWVRVPHDLPGPAPVVVHFQGYGGGRNHAIENLPYAAAGYVHVFMDTRGQGSSWCEGVTPDDAPAGPHFPGWMTLGVEKKETYYYRRLMTDAVLAVEAAAQLEWADASRIGVRGGSQGGGLSLAAAALSPLVKAVAADVPFLCDYRRAVQVTDADPFHEITRYLATHRLAADAVYGVLDYFDGVNMARRATAPARLTAGLMDPIVPPSTAFAAYNAYAGPKEMVVWQHNGHEGGGPLDDAAAIAFFARHLKG